VLTDFPPDYNEQAKTHPAVWTVEDGAMVVAKIPRIPGGVAT
jgi:hypothetical protein